MKHIYFTLLLLCTVLFSHAQIVNIPDANFKSALLDNFPVIDTNDDGEIQVSEAAAMTSLNVENENISDLTGIEAFINLTTLYVRQNQLTTLDMSTSPNLFELRCQNNALTNLNLSQNTNLRKLNCGNNMLTNLDLSSNTGLWELSTENNQLTSLDISNHSELTDVLAENNQLTTINTNGALALDMLYISSNQLTTVDVSSNINLEYFVCTFNQLTSVTLPTSATLSNLDLRNNMLPSIDITGLSNLRDLKCSSNQLTTLDVSTNLLLDRLEIDDNQLTSIDGILANAPSMNQLYAKNNQISSVDLSLNSSVLRLYLNDNILTNLVGNDIIKIIDCTNNSFSTIDLSEGYASLQDIILDDNSNLTYINFKNGNNQTYLYVYMINSFNNLTSLEAVCVDDINGNLANWIQLQNSQTIVFTEYCSFTPGGEFYEVTGSTTLDIDSNGCTNADSDYSNLALQITNGSDESVFYSDENGNYTMPIQDGNYTITPQLENPSYFSVSPTSVSVNFPSDASPFIQDFCIMPNGVHNDVEITIVPLEQARPGFDTNYKLLYKNKGNTTLSGNINLSYNDDVMDLVVAMPVSDAQTVGSLTWNYSNILPFETREILFTMSLNTPTDATFPLNGDDILPFTAMINPINADETPDDNTFTLDQVVVNSFDPNDIRCLEGNEIELDQVGKYVHYLIRFENTGTASAVNVVVKDVIDTNTYDISSLIPLDASHNYVARVVNDNEVEFIFENIQLPFDDATNDGYIMFKIKTMSTLLEGETFSNQAAIYFDFNAPVITNIETTTVENNLSVGEFNTNKTIKIYPNPVVSELFFETNQSIEKITVYNLSGKMIKEFTAKSSSLDKINIRSFAKGMYFMKIQTTNGIQTQKIIKE